MGNKANNIAAAIVLVCIAIIAACGDGANNGDIKAYILAGVCAVIAAVMSEISWRGYLDGGAETAKEKKDSCKTHAR